MFYMLLIIFKIGLILKLGPKSLLNMQDKFYNFIFLIKNLKLYFKFN